MSATDAMEYTPPAEPAQIGARGTRFFMGPKDTFVNRHERYALSDERAAALVVSHRFLNEQQFRELYHRVGSKHYKLSNRATSETDMLVPEWLLNTANSELDKANTGTPPPADCGDTHIYLHVTGPGNYDDPFILRKFRGVTYIWSDKNKWWCLAGANPTSSKHPPCVCEPVGARTLSEKEKGDLLLASTKARNPSVAYNTRAVGGLIGGWRQLVNFKKLRFEHKYKDVPEEQKQALYLQETVDEFALKEAEDTERLHKVRQAATARQFEALQALPKFGVATYANTKETDPDLPEKAIRAWAHVLEGQDGEQALCGARKELDGILEDARSADTWLRGVNENV